MTYCVLVFKLSRAVEPHPFSWQVAPACYAHGVLSHDADETIIVPASGGVEAPRHVPPAHHAAQARAELGRVEPVDQVPLIFRTSRGERLSRLVADSCRTDGILRAGETITDSRHLALPAMPLAIREAVNEARDRAKAAASLEYAAEHDWYPETSLPGVYEQYLIADALAALEELHDEAIPIPRVHAAAVPDLQRRAAQEEASNRV